MSEGKDVSAMQPEELQSAVQSILSDPAFAKLVGELSGAAPSAPPAEEQKDPPPAIPQIPPEMLAKLPQMMSAIAPLLAGGKGGKKEDGPSGDKGDAEKRKRLLAALKPYLSSSRREAVDSILKVTEMTDLMGKMGFGTRNPPK
ncbi:MAG: hypothetical protein J6S41_05195 [Clostridia bacterium]|nr:hypothetical protein [Clostridia bacterium]